MSEQSDSLRIAALTSYFVEDLSLGSTLTRIAKLACVVSGADMAGLTMLVEGKVTTGVFTDPEAARIDEAQYELGDGPCLDAYRHGRVYRIDSTASEDRWPAFAQTARAAGVECTLSLPILAREEPVAALNLYASVEGAFDQEPGDQLGGLLSQAAIVLANAHAYWAARELSENLHQALKSRASIDYAIGIVLSQGGRTPDEAFQVLVRASQRENRKLREIAVEMVERTAGRDQPSSD